MPPLVATFILSDIILDARTINFAVHVAYVSLDAYATLACRILPAEQLRAAVHQLLQREAPAILQRAHPQGGISYSNAWSSFLQRLLFLVTCTFLLLILVSLVQ